MKHLTRPVFVGFLERRGPLLRDIIILLRDTGMRPKKELFPMRVENLDWNNRVIFVPDSQTPTGRRYIPMSDRVVDLLMVRCAARREGWVFLLRLVLVT